MNLELTDDEPEIIGTLSAAELLYPPRNCYADLRALIDKYRKGGREVLRKEAQSAIDIALRHRHINPIQFVQLQEILEGADLPPTTS